MLIDVLDKTKGKSHGDEAPSDALPDNSILRCLDIDEWPWEEIAKEELDDEPEKRAEAIIKFRGLIHEFQKGKKNFKPQVKLIASE